MPPYTRGSVSLCVSLFLSTAQGSRGYNDGAQRLENWHDAHKGAHQSRALGRSGDRAIGCSATHVPSTLSSFRSVFNSSS